MIPQTEEFVDRKEAITSFEKLLQGRSERALAFQAPDGLGKSFLLKELLLQCKAMHGQVVFLDTARKFVPNHWHIIRRMADQLSDAMTRTRATLDRMESLIGPVERLPGGGVSIYATGGGQVVIGGDVTGNYKLVGESDAQEREYRGLGVQVDQAFFSDLMQMCRDLSKTDIVASDPSVNLPIHVLMLLFDDVDQATQETGDWLAQLLRRMWAGDLPGLCVVMTGQNLPESLAGAASDSLDRLTLKPFNQTDVAEYLARVGVPVEKSADFFRSTWGNPGLLHTITSNWVKIAE